MDSLFTHEKAGNLLPSSTFVRQILNPKSTTSIKDSATNKNSTTRNSTYRPGSYLSAFSRGKKHRGGEHIHTLKSPRHDTGIKQLGSQQCKTLTTDAFRMAQLRLQHDRGHLAAGKRYSNPGNHRIPARPAARRAFPRDPKESGERGTREGRGGIPIPRTRTAPESSAARRRAGGIGIAGAEPEGETRRNRIRESGATSGRETRRKKDTRARAPPATPTSARRGPFGKSRRAREEGRKGGRERDSRGKEMRWGRSRERLL